MKRPKGWGPFVVGRLTGRITECLDPHRVEKDEPPHYDTVLQAELAAAGIIARRAIANFHAIVRAGVA